MKEEKLGFQEKKKGMSERYKTLETANAETAGNDWPREERNRLG